MRVSISENNPGNCWTQWTIIDMSICERQAIDYSGLLGSVGSA